MRFRSHKNSSTIPNKNQVDQKSLNTIGIDTNQFVTSNFTPTIPNSPPFGKGMIGNIFIASMNDREKLVLPDQSVSKLEETRKEREGTKLPSFDSIIKATTEELIIEAKRQSRLVDMSTDQGLNKSKAPTPVKDTERKRSYKKKNKSSCSSKVEE